MKEEVSLISFAGNPSRPDALLGENDDNNW